MCVLVCVCVSDCVIVLVSVFVVCVCVCDCVIVLVSVCVVCVCDVCMFLLMFY